ncbi:MAG: DUF2207 domain-containing protein [bacterium]|nr:DUF2207 domain-containing protein [bacterium]
MMKKNLFLIFLLFIILTPVVVFAKNNIYSKDAKIYIDQNGNAHFTETWDVKGEDGTEWYIPLTNLGKSEISNFTVQMDGKLLKFKNWDIDESLSEKAGYYGYNYISNGVELCFGKTDFERHKFVIKYTISNFVFTTDDADVINWRIFEYQNEKTKWTNFTAEISSYYSFPDTLDVWGYGYKGYAYVKDGIIQMSNEGAMGTNYVVLLAKFPKGTFNTNVSYNEYQTFDDVYQKNEEGTFDYDYEEDNKSFFSKLINFIISAINTLLFPVIFIIAIFSSIKSQYGYKNDKKIKIKEIPMFREIPCNKDIYYANTLLYLNNIDYKEANIIGAIILKWIKQDKIAYIKKEKSFSKDESVLDLTKNPTFDNEFEQKLFDIMYKASKDGYLENKELEKWCRNNYSKFFDLFKDKINDNINLLTTEGKIRKRIDRKECKSKNVMSDEIYEDSIKLYGLKKFLVEFSQINTKETIEVKLWDEYLMFAYLFGIADKVSKQLKNLYPEYMAQQLENNNLDFDTIIFINSISSRSVSAASSARSAAQSYSSGGGGFSSGGGGGGSFGGGGSSSGGGSR